MQKPFGNLLTTLWCTINCLNMGFEMFNPVVSGPPSEVESMESSLENATTAQPVPKRGGWRPSAFSGTSDKIHMRLDVRSTAILLRYDAKTRGYSRSRYELGNKCVIMTHFCCEIVYCCCCLIDSGQLQLNH